MSGVCFASPVHYRALKAAFVVLALVLMVPGVEALVKVTGPPAEYGLEGEGIDSRVLLGMADPFESLGRLEGFAGEGQSEVPEVFAQEIGLLPSFQDVRVDGTGSVVGYVVEGDADSVLDSLVGRMESLGWTAVSLGGVDGSTFVKSGGAYTWALVTCTQVEQSTSVVVRCMGP